LDKRQEVEDASILEQFRKGESRDHAFDLLVSKYQERLYWVIRRMLEDHDDTNDVLQDVFVKIFRNLAKFREDAKLFTWMYRIATNESLTFLKKKNKHFSLSLDEMQEELGDRLSAQIDPDADQINQLLQKAIHALPEKQRLVFNLRYFDELGYKEMSEMLGTSEGALKASYHHAVKKVEKFLTQD